MQLKETLQPSCDTNTNNTHKLWHSVANNNCRMDKVLIGLSGYCSVVDDVVIYDDKPPHHANQPRQFLQRCADKKINLNPDKWNFLQSSVTFAGFILSGEGYQISSSITEASSGFPKPSNCTDPRSFFGLANQLSTSTDAVAPLLAPLRPLSLAQKMPLSG